MTDSVKDVLKQYVTESQLTALDRYYELLIEWNEKMNLTAIVERDEVYIKHFWDSLSILDLDVFTSSSEPVRRVIDVGTGAGFPGIPLALCKPEIEVTLCDSLQKRTKFLEVVKQELQLSNVSIYHARSEEFARLSRHRNQYDLVTARAVARLSVLTELLVPFARPGGRVVAYKGPEISDEIEASATALRKLGAAVEAVDEISLPKNMGNRTLVVMKVEKLTADKYPRKPGVPQKQPL